MATIWPVDDDRTAHGQNRAVGWGLISVFVVSVKRQVESGRGAAVACQTLHRGRTGGSDGGHIV